MTTKVDHDLCPMDDENCYGEEKMRRLESEFNVKRIAEFYPDSNSDLPLANIADKAFYVSKGKVTKWGFEDKL